MGVKLCGSTPNFIISLDRVTHSSYSSPICQKTFKHISVDIFPVKGLHNSENICFSVCSDCFHSRSEQEKNREWSGECLLGFLLLEEEKVEVRHFKWFLNKIHSQL